MDSDLNSLRITSLEEEDEEEEPTEFVGEVEDDTDDDEEGDEGVALGFVEKPKNPQFMLRHFFPSKAGGLPAWLDPVDLPGEKSRTCGFCRKPLQFLLQIYAPISEKDSAFHRMLYVFMCPDMVCLGKDQHEQWSRGGKQSTLRSVKVFRCQLPRSNTFYSSGPPKRDGTDKPLTDGAALCCFCGTWTGEKVCSGCKRAHYCSKEHQSLHWGDHKKVCYQLEDSFLAKGKPLAKEKVTWKYMFPEFEVVVEDECMFDTEPAGDKMCAASLVSVQGKIDETFQALSEKFEADNDKKTWASFQDRIARAPEQVLRYCRDLAVKPLWPVSTGCLPVADIPKCKYCEGPLCYETQIMPQLLYYFNVGNEPDSVDWGTIVIYTCLASCEASVSYKEEFAWVQLYPTRSIP